MIKQKRFNFKIASIIAMIFMGLFIAFTNSSVVFANSDYHVSIYGDREPSNLFKSKFGSDRFNLGADEYIKIQGPSFRYNSQEFDLSTINYDNQLEITLKNVEVSIYGDREPSNLFKSKFGSDRFNLGADEYIKIQGPSFRYNSQEFDLSTINYDNQLEITIKPIGVRPEDSVPAISGEHTVIANVDNPYTIDRIKQIAELTATDAYYGDLTNDIEVVSDNYTPNSSKVGDYEIEFKVTNDSNLSTTFVLVVAVKDLTAPVINGKATSSISYTEQFDIENLLATYTVTDNHDLTVKLNVDSNGYTGSNIGVPGVYQIKLSATDSSGNKSTAVHTLTVVDDVAPKIIDEHSGTIQINWRDRVDDNMLLMGLTANDHIDGDITDSISIIENNLKTELGTYTVKYQVKDAAGNKTTYTRTYKVITTDAPIFWVSKNLLLISEVNALTNQQLANELAKYEGIQMASFAMVFNEYTGNEDIPGEYEVKVAIADVQGVEHQVTRTIRVFAEDDLPEVQPTFFEKIVKFFVSIWNLIVKIFNWIINAIKWLYKLIFGWIK